MPEFTQEEMQQLQQVFKAAAASLPRRVFTGARLEWKPGKVAAYRQMIVACKNAAFDEYKKAKTANPNFLNANTGTRARSNAVVGRGIPTNNRHDKMDALVKGQGPADALAMIKAGATWGVEKAIDPMQEQALTGIVEMVKESGLIGAAAVDSGVDLAKEVMGCLPLIGAATNLGQGVVNSVNAILKQKNINKITKLSGIVTPGNPRSGLYAVRALLERKRNDYAYNAALDIAAGSAQTASVFVDGGAVIGSAAGFAKTALKLLYSIMRTRQNFMEFKQGNQLLESLAEFDANDIELCPILGAYVITEAETSTLLAFLAGGSLGRTWMDEVEKSKGDISTLIRLANNCQLIAPYELKGLRASYNAPQNTLYKGSHFLDFRVRKTPQRIRHEAEMIARRDPRGAVSFGRGWLAKLGIS